MEKQKPTEISIKSVTQSSSVIQSEAKNLTKVLCLFLAFFMAEPSFSCTTFSFGQTVGKSYDWDQQSAVILINKRNVKKSSLVIRASEHTKEWTSKYASLTFNQYGQEFPLGGMNEKGLVVEIMVLDETRYPSNDNRETLNELQWIQYQLDLFATVEEAVLAEPQTRISKVYANVHYLMCDQTSACATFEYINGRAKIHTGADLPYSALANHSYERSIEALKGYEGYGGNKPIPQNATSSLDRFATAVSASRNPEGSARDFAFNILSRVNNPGYTKFNIVYEQATGEISFRTSANRAIKTIRLNAFSFSCKDPVSFIAIQNNLEGDVTTNLAQYSIEENKNLVLETVGGLGLPESLQRLVWNYPTTTTCVE